MNKNTTLRYTLLIVNCQLLVADQAKHRVHHDR